jgi:hypothetical protein
MNMCSCIYCEHTVKLTTHGYPMSIGGHSAHFTLYLALICPRMHLGWVKFVLVPPIGMLQVSGAHKRKMNKFSLLQFP